MVGQLSPVAVDAIGPREEGFDCALRFAPKVLARIHSDLDVRVVASCLHGGKGTGP
jgi:hypothetical protein